MFYTERFTISAFSRIKYYIFLKYLAAKSVLVGKAFFNWMGRGHGDSYVRWATLQRGRVPDVFGRCAGTPLS